VVYVPGIEQDSVLWTSAKTGAGCNEIFPAVVKRLPSPTGSREAPLQCLLFDSWFDEYRGVVCVISVVNGSLSVGSEIVAVSTGRRYNIQEIGLVTPAYYPVKTLSAGQVGYVIAGMKTPQEANIGDTFASTSNATASLPGFKPSKPMVCLSVVPKYRRHLSMLFGCCAGVCERVPCRYWRVHSVRAGGTMCMLCLKN
jgi:translation elongation factor EF-4